MIEKVSNYIVDNMLYKGENIEGDQRDIMLFGVTRIIEDIPKYAVIIILCYILNILTELGIVFSITVMYKTFIGGAHAKNNIQCLVVSLITFLIPIFLSKYLDYNNIYLYTVIVINILFSIYVIIKIAPADTTEIPIINKQKRKQLKIGAIVSLVIISIISTFLLTNIVYSRMIIYTMIIINICTLKPVYRLLGCKYGYESEEYKDLY